MTYLEMLKELQKLTDEQLSHSATVYISADDEFLPVRSIYTVEECDVLDTGSTAISTGEPAHHKGTP